MKPIDLSTIRKQNLHKILDLLTGAPAQTRQDLARRTGLSLMTVSNMIDLLKERDLLCFTPVLRESGHGARASSGRKAEAITLCGDRHAWLLVDISGRQFRMSLLGFDLQTLLDVRDTGSGSYLQRLEAFLAQNRERLKAALQSRSLLGAAVVTPGPYEITSDTVRNQRLPELNGVLIKAFFQRHLGDYDYYVDEDVKFAVRAFSTLIEQNRCELLYYLYIGEGVGGAAVHNGNMLRGLNATAGDAGQLTDPSGRTYESLLSLSAFAALLGVPAQTSAEMLMHTLDRLAEQEPERYKAALRAAAARVASMLHSVLWMLDPSDIIIDCPYAAPYEDCFTACILENLKDNLAASHRATPAVSPAPRGMSSVLRGAVQVLQREWIERALS